MLMPFEGLFFFNSNKKKIETYTDTFWLPDIFLCINNSVFDMQDSATAVKLRPCNMAN